MSLNKPFRHAAAAAAVLMSPLCALSDDSMAWLRDDPAAHWTAQLRLNLEIDEQSTGTTAYTANRDRVLDWVFWRDLQVGKNMSLRSKESTDLIQDIAIFTKDSQAEDEDQILLTSFDSEASKRKDDRDTRPAHGQENVVALAHLPPGNYRVSVVLNTPPEAFHISAEMDNHVKIHEFIRDRESRIKLVSGVDEEVSAWRYSFSAKVEQQRKITIRIERALHGFVALDDLDDFGSMGIVIETDGYQTCDSCHGGAGSGSTSWPTTTVVRVSNPLVIQQMSTPFEFNHPTTTDLGTHPTTWAMQPPWNPTTSQVNLGWGGGGGGGMGYRGGDPNNPTIHTPTLGFEIANPTPVPEPIGLSSSACWLLVACLKRFRVFRSRGTP